MTLHELLTIDARAGYPGTLLRARHTGGRLLYLEVTTAPVVQVAALDAGDVRRLRDALDVWLHENAEHTERAPYAGPAPLVGGAVSRGLADAAARWGRATVQSCTAATPARPADQHVPGGHDAGPAAPRRAPV